MPGDRRRQDERQLDERDRERVAGEAAVASRYAVGVPKRTISACAIRLVLRLTTKRVAHDGVRELVDQLAGRGVREDRDDRQHEENERHERGRDERRGEEHPPHAALPRLRRRRLDPRQKTVARAARLAGLAQHPA